MGLDAILGSLIAADAATLAAVREEFGHVSRGDGPWAVGRLRDGAVAATVRYGARAATVAAAVPKRVRRQREDLVDDVNHAVGGVDVGLDHLGGHGLGLDDDGQDRDAAGRAVDRDVLPGQGWDSFVDKVQRGRRRDHRADDVLLEHLGDDRFVGDLAGRDGARERVDGLKGVVCRCEDGDGGSRVREEREDRWVGRSDGGEEVRELRGVCGDLRGGALATRERGGFRAVGKVAGGQSVRASAIVGSCGSSLRAGSAIAEPQAEHETKPGEFAMQRSSETQVQCSALPDASPM